MRIPKVVVLGVSLTIGLLAIGVAVRHDMVHRAMVAGRYYCPMHPNYTSDKPGDCPICNMKLVKKEPDQQSAISDQHTTKNLESICYLHNCPKVHEGRPCPMMVLAKAGEKVTCPICGSHIAEAVAAKPERKILYWTDPMIPGYKADGPGKSPMGMDLVPVYSEEAGGTGTAASPEGYANILLTPQKQQLIGVKTALVERRQVTKTVRTVGIVAHDPELYQAQSELIQAQQALTQAVTGGNHEVIAQARQLVDSSRLRLRHLGLSDAMVDDVAAWTKPDHRLLLGGAGEYWIYASIYEYELPLIRTGQVAAIRIAALPDRTFSGIVKAIDPMLDAMTRTSRARILVEDPEGVLKPEMYVDVSIACDLGTLLTVPEEAVFATGTKHIVFVDKGQGRFEPRDVTVGVKADRSYEIREGLAEGEPVVTSGNFLIDSESRLKGALQQSSGETHQHDP